MTDDIIKQINALAKKAKNEGLTAEETELRDKLRQEYIKGFRQSLKSTLDNTYIVDGDGNKTAVKDRKK